jgi:hypothetical protein
MATLSDLVSEIALQTDLPKSTIFAFGRFAREAGFISQGGRGKGGAKMTDQDAANLLIALGGTSVTREAPDAIRRFRPMQGYVTFLDDDLENLFREWLSPFELAAEDQPDLEINFGAFLDWLIAESREDRLLRLLEQIPVVVIPDDDYARIYEKYKDSNIEMAVSDGALRPHPDGKNRVGEDIHLKIIFDRSRPSAKVEISRKWGSLEDVFRAQFFCKPAINQYLSNIVVSATLNEQIILYIGHVLGYSDGGVV